MRWRAAVLGCLPCLPVLRACLSEDVGLAWRVRCATLEPENVMVVFKETQWENWSFAGGRLIHR